MWNPYSKTARVFCLNTQKESYDFWTGHDAFIGHHHPLIASWPWGFLLLPTWGVSQKINDLKTIVCVLSEWKVIRQVSFDYLGMSWFRWFRVQFSIINPQTTPYFYVFLSHFVIVSTFHLPKGFTMDPKVARVPPRDSKLPGPMECRESETQQWPVDPGCVCCMGWNPTQFYGRLY